GPAAAAPPGQYHRGPAPRRDDRAHGRNDLPLCSTRGGHRAVARGPENLSLGAGSARPTLRSPPGTTALRAGSPEKLTPFHAGRTFLRRRPESPRRRVTHYSGVRYLELLAPFAESIQCLKSAQIDPPLGYGRRGGDLVAHLVGRQDLEFGARLDDCD